MTKWICNFCNKPCYAEPCGSEDYIPSHCLFQDENNWCDWKRVDEAPLAGCPPFKRDDGPNPWFKERLEDMRVGLMLQRHESDIQEMAGNLNSLKERVDESHAKRDDEHKEVFEWVAGDIEAFGLSLKELKDRVETVEKRIPDCWVTYTDWVRGLEKRIGVLEKESQHAGPYAAALDHLNLREAVKRLEHRIPNTIDYDTFNERLERLEHQMRKHYHGGPVWCETEDGSGTERLVK